MAFCDCDFACADFFFKQKIPSHSHLQQPKIVIPGDKVTDTVQNLEASARIGSFTGTQYVYVDACDSVFGLSEPIAVIFTGRGLEQDGTEVVATKSGVMRYDMIDRFAYRTNVGRANTGTAHMVTFYAYYQIQSI